MLPKSPPSHPRSRLVHLHHPLLFVLSPSRDFPSYTTNTTTTATNNTEPCFTHRDTRELSSTPSACQLTPSVLEWSCPPCTRAPPLTPLPPTCGTSLHLHAVPPPRTVCRSSKLACSQTPLRGKRAHAPIQVPMAALWNNSSYHLAHRTTGIHSKCTLSHNFACSTGPISDSTSFATSGFWSSPSDHGNLCAIHLFLFPNLVKLSQHGACATEDSPVR